MTGEALELAGMRALVLGLGVSGRSAAAFLAARGARVTASDVRDRGELSGLEALPASVELVTGGGPPDPAGFDLVVPSPGVPRDRWAPRARRAWGDVELAFRFLRVPVVAVTGTNGKSTTVRLVETMLRAAGWRARAAGNVGEPALSLVGEPLDAAVLEVSSFQLEAVESFRPRVGVVLNVSADHLDRHGDIEAYAATKARLLGRQQPGDVAVLNADDPRVRAMAGAAPGRVLFFSLAHPLERGLFWDGTAALWRDEAGVRRFALDGLRLAGLHNLENALAALAAVVALGADPERALDALPAFRALPHRCEPVARRAGVLFVDDSKATNPGAAQRSLEGFDAPVWWIAGGRDKGLDFGPLADAAAGRVRGALLVGECADKLAAALAGRVQAEVAGSVEEAVRRAAARARPGDVVLLAPACASFDQFSDYAERGRAFRRAVEALGPEEAA